ncbi:helix-turn-helix domain-containing protein [Streptomyces sp. RFCAC02]|uniref:helix-turn-helix domain-containing protein n=1 Tax=Streptomyces sp. RFCAC02 TaxID=2499143 RepID=UPI00101F32FB|nr:helix-turn-helix domain-containing protein [Streptomyces sp. RFCAC02]
MDGGVPTELRTLAQKIDYLFETVHPKHRGPYTHEEVATGIRERGGPTISASYIWLLRKGQKDNPTMKHLQALGDFFGVPPAYFFDSESSRRIAEELATLAAMRDSQVRSVALRAQGLSPETLRTIQGFIERARTLEGLPDEDPPEGRPEDSGAT